MSIRDITSVKTQKVDVHTWLVTFVLNTARHRMDCEGTPVVACSFDRYGFKPLNSVGVSEVSTPFGDPCNSVWLVTEASSTGALFVGFKVKFQEDVLNNGLQFNPRRKTAQAPIRLSNEEQPLGLEVDITDRLVDLPDVD